MTRFRPKALLIAATLYSLLTLLLLGTKTVSSQEAGPEFEACFVPGVARQVKCLDLPVPENWDDPGGKQISLHLVVVPAQGADAESDPLVILAGGPGQAATDYAKLIPISLNRVNQKRDILLIDQRGTGSSTPLECQFPSGTTAAIPFSELGEGLKACIESFEADMRYFTSFDIIRDLEHLRKTLAIGQVNIWGGSYGTRLGLLYMKLHPESVRSAVLDGVTAPNSRLFVSAPGSAEAAWQALLGDCMAEPACAAAYPDLDRNFRVLLDRLAETPETRQVRDIWSGEMVGVVIDRDWLAETVRTGLYIPTRAALLPFALERAGAGDYQPLMALVQDGNFWAGQTMAVGSTLAILCSEEVPRNPAEDAARGGAASFHGDYYYRFWALACRDVPTRNVLEGYEEPVTGDIPTLILSGGLDPVTPPEQGQIAEAHLSRVWHIVANNAGHNVTPVGCAPRLIAEFIENASGQGIDFSCISATVRPPFLVSPLTYGLKSDPEGDQK